MDFGMVGEASNLILLAGFSFNPFKAAKKIVKKAVKTVLSVGKKGLGAPKKLVKVVKRGSRWGVQKVKGTVRYGKDKVVGVIRSPGRLFRVDAPDAPGVIGVPDEEELLRMARRAAAARRGSRTRTVLTKGRG